MREPSDLAIESLRSLRTSIQFALIESRSRIISLGGPSPGIGKSFIASNLAQVLAESGKRTLLIDADLRNGSQNRVFERPRAPGLAELLAGTARVDEATHRMTGGLDLLTCGEFPSHPSELLASPRFRELIERAEKEYDLIIIDTPPVLAATDATLVAGLAGVNLLVLREGRHALREIETALKRFHHTGAKIAGFVFNDVSQLSNGMGYGYHYQYQYKPKKAV
jgi:tyrosine-protein kinase Etk/Wzc